MSAVADSAVRPSLTHRTYQAPGAEHLAYHWRNDTRALLSVPWVQLLKAFFGTERRTALTIFSFVIVLGVLLVRRCSAVVCPGVPFQLCPCKNCGALDSSGTVRVSRALLPMPISTLSLSAGSATATRQLPSTVQPHQQRHWMDLLFGMVCELLPTGVPEHAAEVSRGHVL